MNLTKFQIKTALKFMSKKELKRLSELSEDDFLKLTCNNPNTKNMSVDSLKMMYKLVLKKVK